MSLTDIPNEVIFHLILPHLDWNDLLRLRRVCKHLKPLTEDYLRLHKTSEQFVKIDLDGPKKNLTAFLGLGFVAPVSRFRIWNVKPKTWKKKRIQDFANAYGSRITHLQLDSLQIPLSQKAVTFFESLPNLEHLEIFEVEEMGFMLQGKKGTETRAGNPKRLMESIPTTFRRLRVLQVNYYKCAPLRQSAGLIWKFIEECFPSLEHIVHPSLDVNGVDGWNLDRLEGDRLERDRFGYVRKLLMDAPNPPNLRFYDMEDWNFADERTIPDFLQLVRTCVEHNVKLLNVDSELIDEVMWNSEDVDEDFNRQLVSAVVESLTSLHQESFLMELPHLKKIRIGYDEGEGGTPMYCSMPDDEFQRPCWPNLEELRIWINSEFLYNAGEETDVSGIRTSELLDFFFVGIRREKMVKLKMRFDLNNDRLPYPRVVDVCTSCPNLKELTLKEWCGNNDDLSKSWGNLQHLEKVAFKKCMDLRNSAFIGEDKEKPAFLNAKKLRSLEFHGLDEMLEVTDRLFTLVICHMPLKRLRLVSTETLKNDFLIVFINVLNFFQISVAGISSLLEGKFSETIEKLDFFIELEGVTREDLVALEKKFRSSRMM